MRGIDRNHFRSLFAGLLFVVSACAVHDGETPSPAQAPAPASEPQDYSTFTLDGVTYEVPVQKGMCTANSRQEAVSRLTQSLASALRKNSVLLDFQVDCEQLQRAEKGLAVTNGRFQAVAALKNKEGGIDSNSKRMLNFFGLHGALQGGRGSKNQTYIMSQILGQIGDKPNREITCMDLETSKLSVGGRVCVKFTGSRNSNLMNMSASVRPVENMLLMVAIAEVNSLEPAPPSFSDADAILDSMRVARPE